MKAVIYRNRKPILQIEFEHSTNAHQKETVCSEAHRVLRGYPETPEVELVGYIMGALVKFERLVTRFKASEPYTRLPDIKVTESGIIYPVGAGALSEA